MLVCPVMFWDTAVKVDHKNCTCATVLYRQMLCLLADVVAIMMMWQMAATEVDVITSMLHKVADVIATVMICGRW